VAGLLHPLSSGALTPTRIPVGSAWHHIFLDRFPDPLGFGFAAEPVFRAAPHVCGAHSGELMGTQVQESFGDRRSS
jgi:hypothetical protein